MQGLLSGLAGVILFLAGAFAVYKANGRSRFRYRQLLLPVIAFAYGIVSIWRYGDLNSVVQGIVAALTRLFPTLSQVNVAFFEAMVFNFCMLMGFVVVKGIYKVVVALLDSAYSDALAPLVEVFFEFDEDYGYWFLRKRYQGARVLFRNLYVCSLVIASLLYLAAALWPTLPAFHNPFYPALAVLVLGEACFCLLGITKEEYLADVQFEDDGANRVFQYAKMQEVLTHYFGDRLLQVGSRGARRKPYATHGDFCDELIASDDYESRLAGEYFKALVARGVLGEGDRTARYGSLNHDMVLESIRMLKGKSVVFATPFYRDLVPYVFMPLNAQLMRNRRALVLYGSGASEEQLRDYVEEGLTFATGVPGMWRVGTSMEFDADPVDVALIPFSSLGNVRIVIDNARFLEEVGFVVVVDPSSLLATYQIGLNYLAEYLSVGVSPTYCIFDRNSDGLVDSLSHALRANLTEVSATEYAEGSVVYMMWDVDGENLQHRLMPGVAQYLGVGTEIGLVALKHQVSSVAWAANSSVPLADQRWIDGQYYGDLLSFADLPQEQLQLDRRFDWYSDMWAMPKAPARFIVAEDEYANMYEAFRQFSTRGSGQTFVNVLCPHYLLRAYMVDNSEMFEADPKAVPSLSPDFSKSQRNAIFSIVMAMAESDDLVDEDEISARLRYVGVPFHNVYEALQGLLIEHLAISDDYQGVLPEDQLVVREVEEYDPAKREFVQKRYYGLSNQAIYADYFSSLRSVPLITERPDGSKQLLGARLYGHVYQSLLPGQFTVIGGKYYEVVSASGDAGVVLRRAADHFSQRRYYRQLRTYTIENVVVADEANSTRTVSDIVVQRVAITMSVDTQGYLEMSDFGDLAGARKIDVSNVPTRRYTNKTALRLEFPGATSETVVTIAVLMSEFLITLFPKDWNYISVLTSCANSLPAGVLPRIQGQCPPNVIYVVEDSLVDIGLVSCIDRNIQRIMELCWDYLDWHAEQLRGVVEEQPEWDVGTLPPFVPPPVRKGFFARLLDKIRSWFNRGRKDEPGGAAASASSTGQDAADGTAAAAAGEGAAASVDSTGQEAAESAAAEGAAGAAGEGAAGANEGGNSDLPNGQPAPEAGKMPEGEASSAAEGGGDEG